MELTIRINGKVICQKAVQTSKGYKWDLPGFVIDRELQEKERDIDRNTEKGS